MSMNRRLALAAMAAAAALAPTTAAHAARLGYTTFSPGYNAFSTSALTPVSGGGALAGLSLVHEDGSAAMGVLRIDRRGKPVKAFGTRGMASAAAGSKVFEDVTDIVRDADGSIVATGTSELTPPGQE